MSIDNPYIPLVTAAAELDAGVRHLADRLGPAVLIDGAGLRVITRELCAQLIAEKNARQQAEAERAARAREQARANDTTRAARERVRAIRQHQLDASLQLDDLDLASAAHAVMTAGHHAARQQAAASHLDEMWRVSRDGSSIGMYHSLTGKQED